MKKILNTNYGWALFLLFLLAINLLASLKHSRIDLTRDKRYTLSEPVKKMLRNLDGQVDITVFLKGDMPAGFKKLAANTEDLLREFKEFGKTHLRFNFMKPGEGMSDADATRFLDSLHNLGLNPTNVKAQVKDGEGQEERYLYPGALIRYGGKAAVVDLLQGQSRVEGINSLNNAEALLEYRFAGAIHQLTRSRVPRIGYLSGNGEPLDYEVYSLIEGTIRPNYEFNILPVDSVPAIPPAFDALMVVKPTVAFTDEQKLKLDQYIMQGGKVLWMIDELYAEMDSLQRVQSEFIAFDRNLNLEDLLFKYGVRINPDLVQSLNADKFGMVIGNMGGKPQMDLLPWPYFPLLQNTSGHPIARNLDYISSQFPNSIDTVEAAGIRKTILLTTSGEARILHTPAKVMLQSIRSEEDIRTFTLENVPVAVLLEGKFSSLYTYRISPAMKDSMAAHGFPFREQNSADNKMIVVSDGDLALNAVSQSDGPLPLGTNLFTRYQYANREFILNCLEYLTDNSGILETRGKDYTLRLLDKAKMA